jgi:hypothetical protein
MLMLSIVPTVVQSDQSAPGFEVLGRKAAAAGGGVAVPAVGAARCGGVPQRPGDPVHRAAAPYPYP